MTTKFIGTWDDVLVLEWIKWIWSMIACLIMME